MICTRWVYRYWSNRPDILEVDLSSNIGITLNGDAKLHTIVFIGRLGIKVIEIDFQLENDVTAYITASIPS